MDPQEGKTAGAPEPGSVSTKLLRIAELARKAPGMAFNSLAHHIDMDFLREAYGRTRKDGAPGIDGQTAQEYERNLEGNLRNLLERLKSGRYHAPPVRRVHIPKGDGSKTRPIGIPTFEDKVLQRAVAMVLEAVYEEEFHPMSFGFRPGRSAHEALETLWKKLMKRNGGVVLELDIQSFFDTLDHGHLRGFLDQRVRDGVLRRAIDKWLKAGVLEQGQVHRPAGGTPQGGVISPILANIYLHQVFDAWFVREVQPRLRGRAFFIRYADDAVIVFEAEADARRVLEVLPKRFGKYGLTLHPQKTRQVKFRAPDSGDGDGPDGTGGHETFDFLGFTHVWGRTHKGGWSVQRRTMSSRLTRALSVIRAWLRRNLHLSMPMQHAALHAKVLGHYAYYGITGNLRALQNFVVQVERSWRAWLSRRSRVAYVNWADFRNLRRRFPLPRPRIVHSAIRP